MLFQLVLDSIPVRVFWKDRESCYLGCNRLFAKDAGQESPDDMLGKNDYEFTWRDQADLYRADDAEVMERGIAKINYEEPQTTPSGMTIWLRTSKVPLKGKDGKVFGVMGCYEEITEQKKTEESLVENARFLQSLINAIPSPIFYKDAKGVYLGCNKAFEAYLGKESDEIIGKTVFDMGPRELAEKYQQKDNDLFQEGGKQVYESQVVHADGSKHDVEFNKAVFKKSDGSPDGLIGVMLDITERKRVGQLLAESERKYRGLAENLSQLIYRADPETLAATYVNRSIKKIYGYTPEEWLADPSLWAESIHPDDRDRVFPLFDAAAAKKEILMTGSLFSKE